MNFETEEIRQYTLQTGGSLLDFGSFDFYGFPGFALTRLYDGETSVYRVEKQVFSFSVSTKDCFDNDVEKDMTFTMSDEVYLHKFKLESNPIPDLTGWSRLNVIWTSKEDV